MANSLNSFSIPRSSFHYGPDILSEKGQAAYASKIRVHP